MVLIAVVLALLSIGGQALAAPIRAKNLSEEQWLNDAGRNNILFYDPCIFGSGSGEGGGAVIVDGNSVAEKIWNWFVSAGIAGVSDNPNVIAGIIGNFMTEAGGNTFDINPFVVSPSGYYGMYQAGGGRADGLKAAFDAAGLGSLWGSSLSSVSEEELDKSIDVTLNYLVNADDGSFRVFVSALGEAENTPSGYSDMFLVIVERAVGGNSPILDPGAKRRSNGGDYQASAARRDNAERAYDAFAGNADGGVERTSQNSSCRRGSGEEDEGEYVECGTGGSINSTAIAITWPSPHPYNDPSPAYQQAMEALDIFLNPAKNPDHCASYGGSCDVFVYTVMQCSGADTAFPLYLGGQRPYLNSHPELYEKLPIHGTTPQPGDIRLVNGEGHIEMVTTNKSGSGLAISSASHCDRSADTGNYYTTSGWIYRFRGRR